jgi:predicted ferric reductase
MKVRLHKFTYSAIVLILLFHMIIAACALFLVVSMRDMVFFAVDRLGSEA